MRCPPLRWLLLLLPPVLAATLVAGAGGVTNAAPAQLTAKEVNAARKVYVAKCAKCHRFYEPTDYGPADWRVWMDKMGRKSKLSADQTRVLNQYLDLYRAGQWPVKPEQELKPARPGGSVR